MPSRRIKIADVRYNNAVDFIPTVGGTVERSDYSNVYWHCAHFRQCSWTDVRLHHSSFNHRSEIYETTFESCRFTGRYTNLSALFERCIFTNCVFVGITFWGARLRDCTFNECRFEKMFFAGPLGPESWRTMIERCDFTTSVFVDTDFRLGIDTSSSKFASGFNPHWIYPAGT